MTTTIRALDHARAIASHDLRQAHDVANDLVEAVANAALLRTPAAVEEARAQLATLSGALDQAQESTNRLATIRVQALTESVQA